MCLHKNKVDLTQGLGFRRHFYCKDCGWHLYNDIEYTKQLWDDYVNLVDTQLKLF